MTTKAIHILMLLAAISLSCIACSEETVPQLVPDGGGQLRIAYKIAGVSMSRVPEDGWDNGWNENKVTRIDLFVFNNDADKTLFKHVSSTEIPEFEEVEKAQTEQTFEQDKLTYNDIVSGSYTYYMVANCPSLDGINETDFTLDDLKEKLTPNLTFNQPQTSFAMDGMIENTPSPTDNTITLSFKLERAAAKIRLSVFGVNDESIIDECSFRLHNYVSDGTYVLTESEKYCINTSQLHHDMPQYQDWNSTLKYHDTEENIDKAIFYSYPNDWFDESLLNEDGTFIAEDGDTYAKDDLIDEARQTYIVVEYKKNTYKVPVNFSIANDNDRTFANDEEEIAYIKEIRDKYYRIKRNHIYDIKATIDVEANKIEVEHKILVNAWNEKENMDVIFGDESNESNESN
ncbi:MAG: hypothetical protein H9802_16090 [Candidatus Phocaeicola faecipullorum]|nr:hypothetical protein [Candidatus Phocaeicola faecipullorum]